MSEKTAIKVLMVMCLALSFMLVGVTSWYYYRDGHYAISDINRDGRTDAQDESLLLSGWTK